MTDRSVGDHTRLFANVLTTALSAFATWGWCADISWPLNVSAWGSGTLAAICLVSQHLANGAAAHAQRALSARKWLSSVVGVALAVVFAAATAVGVEHAWQKAVDLQRREALAPIEAQIERVDAELAASQAALRAIPADVPGSRIVLLQAPLRAAIADAHARRAALESNLAQLAAAGGENEGAHLIFWVLGFAEPALYWLLASTLGPGVSRVPTQLGDASRETRGKSRPFAAVLALAALAVPAGVIPPPRVPGRLPNVQDVQIGGSHPAGRAAPSPSHSLPRAGRRPDGVPDPDWLAKARALRVRGLSFRAIAVQLGCCSKSAIARQLRGIPRGAPLSPARS